MKQIVTLRTSGECIVRIVLDNWGSGLDQILRRWTLEGGCWRCTDTGELAEESTLTGVQVFNGKNPVLLQMPV
jgi:hypothetical protein